jgi:Sec-independent protein secretion pathway component TatC
MFNIAFADIIGFIHPGALESITDGSLGFPVTSGLLLLFSVITEVPIAMIFLCLILSVQANRWLNTIAVVITMLFVVGGGSATSSYFFFAAVEIISMFAILWYA